MSTKEFSAHYIGSDLLTGLINFCKHHCQNHRKYCVWRIFAPYFINVKHLLFSDSYIRISQWLESCSKLRVLNFDPAIKINDSLNRSINTGYLPISFDNSLKEPRTLKTDNRELYNIIVNKYQCN